MNTGPSVLDRDNVRVRVDAAVRGFLAGKELELAQISPDLDVVSAALTDLLSGGKRLRAAFCWWGWRSCGGHDVDAALIAASSLELLQGSALIHDDLMDDSDTRRGEPSIHRRFAALHAQEGWRGSDTRFGAAAAVLLGDACLSWVDEMFADSGLNPVTLERGRPFLNVMKTEVMAGQFLDVAEQARGGGSLDRALNIARYKSAKYTVERPLQLGAALAGGDEQALEALSRYGIPLGEAFQLRDDVLGIYGDPKQTGKPAGDDLREGKRTVLLALALEAGDETEREFLSEMIGSDDISDSDIERAREIIEHTQALAKAEQLITSRTAEALAAIEPAPLEPFAIEALTELAQAATSRSA